MASFAGLGALSVACCYLLYALYARFVLNESPAGFTALIFFIVFLSGVQMLFLGLIGEYLGLNLGNGFFEDRTIPFGLHAPSLPFTGFGTSFFDYDNDGWLDLLVLNGAVRLLEDRAREGEPYPLQQTNQLFHNRRGASFEEVTHIAGPTFRVPEVSRGAAFGDVDNDGDTDVVLFNNNGRARLLLNEASNCRHWLGLRLLGNGTHRDTTQARVEVLAPGGTSLWRRGHSDGSYCSASDSRILVGMGDDDRPRTVRVHWSPSVVEQWRALTVDRYWTLQKGHRTPGK